MPVSDNPLDVEQQQQLTKYLLGLVPESEAEQIDEASIADDEIASRLRVAEDDLVDDYIRGKLATEWREAFELRYLASQRRRNNVQFIGAFLRAVDGDASTEKIRGSGGGPLTVAGCTTSGGVVTIVVPAGRSWKMFSTVTAVAATLLLAAGVLLVQAMRLRSGLDVARQHAAVLDQRGRELQAQLADQRLQNDRTSLEADRLRAAAASASPAPRPSPASTMALVLLPQTRANNPVPAVVVSAHAERVAFELQLEPNDFAQYRVVLRDPKFNRAIWSSEPMSAPRDQATTLAVALPASLLEAQHYLLTLTANDSSDAEVISSYPFQVVRR
jgi:Tfp pilus assembly protein PilN